MADKWNDYLDEAGITRIVDSRENKPYRILGPRKVKGGILIQCFFREKKKSCSRP